MGTVPRGCQGARPQAGLATTVLLLTVAAYVVYDAIQRLGKRPDLRMERTGAPEFVHPMSTSHPVCDTAIARLQPPTRQAVRLPVRRLARHVGGPVPEDTRAVV